MALEFSDNFDRQALLHELGRTPTSAPPATDRDPDGLMAWQQRERAMNRGTPSAPRSNEYYDNAGTRSYGGAAGPSLSSGGIAPSQAPAALAAGGGYGQYRDSLEGFDHGKMDAGHISPKYVYAKYASHYSPQQLASDANARAELAQRLKDDPSGFFSGGVEFTGPKFDRLKVLGPLHDKFEGYGEFDVIRAAGEGGRGHQWGAIGGGSGNAGGAVRGLARAASRVPQDQGSAYERIMALINQNGDAGLDDQALRSILGIDPNRMGAL